MRASNWGLAWVVLLIAGSLLADEPKATVGGLAEAPFQVRGQVVDEGDSPVAGAEVKALVVKGCPSAVSGGDGRFVMELPRKPPQILSLHAAAEGQARQAFVFHRLDDREELPAEFKLVLRPAREINVVAVDAHGQPVQDAKVIIFARYFYAMEAQTNAEGKAVLRVSVDTELVTVSARRPGVGFDYFRYQTLKAPESDPYCLPQDHALPLTFVLNGCRQVTVRAIDDHGHPMAGVSVRPVNIEKPKKGGPIWNGDIRAATDENGIAIFDDLPTDCTDHVCFEAEADGYVAPGTEMLAPGSDAAEITATLLRLAPARGQVNFVDGRPAAGAKVQVAGHGFVGRHFRGEANADERGRFELDVYQNQFYVFAAVLDDSITPLVTLDIVEERPTDEIRLVLRKATRVHGRLTIGPDRKPYAGQRLVLHRKVDDAYEKLSNSDQSPKPDPKNDYIVSSSSSVTDEHGEFEFLGAQGKQYIIPPAGVPSANFVLTDEAEFEINLHADRPSQVEFTGRVISRDEPRQGVAGASVTSFAMNHQEDPGGMRATSDAQGSFRAARRTVATLVYTRTEDGSLAGIVRVGPDDLSADIPVAAAATVHGRLIDPAMGGPLRNVEVIYGISWEGPSSGDECGGSVRTNERGEFTVNGLVPGWQYTFMAIRAKIPAPRPGHRVHLTRTTPDGVENIDLGDFKFDLSGKAMPVSATTRVPAAKRSKIYDTEADGNEQIAAALKTAKAGKKHVLLQFGADWCGWCHKLSDCLKENEEIAAALRENYVLVLIDVNLLGKKKHNADVNERYGNPARHGLPVLVVLDADGNVLKTKDTGELNVDDDYGPKKVLAFLNRWKPE